MLHAPKRILTAKLLLSWLIWVVAQPLDCPEPHRGLLEEYKAFHRANKHARDAQYIVQHCWGKGCEGVGDRIRGTLFLLRVAIHYKKIIIIDWKNPAPLTNFLLPNEIDWTLTGFEEGFFNNHNGLTLEEFNATTYDGAGSDAAIAKFRATKVFTTTGVRPFEANVKGLVPVVDAIAQRRLAGSCHFQFLFKPHPKVVQLGEAHLQRLYGPKPSSFIAWHWRHYDVDFRGERHLDAREMLLSLTCAEKLARAMTVDLSKRPVLLITDFHNFRKMVSRGAFPKITTPNITATHIDKGRHPLNAYVDVFVDIYVMSRARCLLTSRSGFSKVALWMGGKDMIGCSVDRLSCAM